MFKEYLKKLQELQWVALNASLNCHVEVHEARTDQPWIYVLVYEEGLDYEFVARIHMIFDRATLYMTDWDEAKKILDGKIEMIVNFINEHKR